MSYFITKLDVERVDDANWQLLSPLVYVSDHLGRTVEVPQGFLTDFASVPRLPLAYALFGGIAQAEAVVHDYLYRTPTEHVARADADATFLEAMEVMGKPPEVRYPMYWGVRAGGWMSFHKREVTCTSTEEAPSSPSSPA
jgi:hypothetical protein